MFEGNFLHALGLTMLAGLATGLGGVIVMFSKKFSPKFLAASMGFSAGVMLLISLVELFTDARSSLSVEYGDKMGLFYTLLSFFGGMAIIAIIDNLVPSAENPHEFSPQTLEIEQNIYGAKIKGEKFKKSKLPDKTSKESSLDASIVEGSGKLLRIGIVSSIVIAVHNFPEGIATFVSSMDNPNIGLSIAFAVGIHNIPEGIAVAIPIYYATKNRWKAISYATLSGLAEPLGGVLGYLLLSQIFSHSFMGIILALVAGIMVYIALDELLPTAENYGEHHIAIIGVIGGMAFMGFGLLLFA